MACALRLPSTTPVTSPPTSFPAPILLSPKFETRQRICRLTSATWQISTELLLGTGQFDAEQFERLRSFHLEIDAILGHGGQIGQQPTEAVRRVLLADAPRTWPCAASRAGLGWPPRASWS